MSIILLDKEVTGYDFFDLTNETFKNFQLSSNGIEPFQYQSINLGAFKRAGFTFSGELVFCSNIVSNINCVHKVETLRFDFRAKTFYMYPFDIRYLQKSKIRLPINIFNKIKFKK